MNEEVVNNQNKKENLSTKIEAILFWNGEAMKQKELAKIFQVEEKEIVVAIKDLKNQLQGRGIVLLERDDEVMLVASNEVSELLERLTKEELDKDLGKAALETLAIILYQGPVKRSELDYIRGVNSQAILRSLMVRGLIDKEVDPTDARSFIYKPSFELMSYLNISKIDELPEFEQICEAIDGFRNQNAEEKPSEKVLEETPEEESEIWDEDLDEVDLEEEVS